MSAIRLLVGLICLIIAFAPRSAAAQAEINFSVAENTVYTDSLQTITVEMCTQYILRDTTATLINSAGSTNLFLTDGPAAACSGEQLYAFLLDLNLKPGTNWVKATIVDWFWTTYEDSVKVLYQPPRAKVTAPGLGGVRLTPLSSQVLPFVLTNIGTVTTVFDGVVRCTGPFVDCRVAGADSLLSVSIASGESKVVDVSVTSTAQSGSGSVRVVTTGALPDSATTPLLNTATTAPAPVVRAGVDTLPAATNITGVRATFIVHNPDPVAARSLTFGVTCAPEIACTAPGSILLQPLQDSVIHVSVNTFADTLGKVRRVALRTYATLPSDTLHDTTYVKIAKNLAGVLELAVIDPHPGASVARDQCLSIAAGASAAVECGALRIAYDLPGVRTMGRSRAPTLLYSSQHAQPQAQIPLRLRRIGGNHQTGDLTFETTLRSMPNQPVWSTQFADTVPWSEACTTADGCLFNLSLDIAGAGVGTGVYRVEITANQDQYSDTDSAATSRLVVVNDGESAFGAGWWLEGLERLIPADTGGDAYLWIGGDGSSRLFERQNDTLFAAAAPLVSRTEFLVSDTAETWFERRVTKALLVRFDALLRHSYTQNAQQHRTYFHYDSSDFSRLDSISVPKHSGGTSLRAFTFQWSGTFAARRLASIKTLGVASGTWREATVHLDGSDRVDWIRDAAGDTVKFEYTSGDRVSARRDRLGARTLYGYDIAGTVSSVGVIVGSDTLTTTICSQEARTVASCSLDGGGTAPVSASRWNTRVDGPRPDADARDVSRFYLGRFGAPDSIVDPLGGRTRLWREHSTLQALVTRVVDVAGLQTTAAYDSRGLITSSAVKGPFGDTTQVATTTFVWDTTWHALKQITQPTGVVQNFGVRTSDGMRVWEQLGSSSSTRVNFAYTSSRLLRRVTVPGGVVLDSLTFNSYGNPTTVTRPLGTRLSYVANTDGSVQKVITRAFSDTLTLQRLAYDALGRVVRDTTKSYRLGYEIQTEAVESILDTTVALTAVVATTYDKEGRPLTVQRLTATSGYGAATAISTWAYDAAGRTTRTTSGGAADSVYYDRGGNAIRIKTKRGLVIRQTFDALGRITSRTTPEVRTVATYCTDCHGDSGPIPSDTVKIPEYSTALTDDFYTKDVVIPTETAIFGYDAAGRMIQADNPQVRVRRSYYPNGALKADTSEMRLYYPGSGSGYNGTHRYTLNYAYNLAGQRTSRIDGFGGHQIFAYNALGQLSSTTDSAKTTDTLQVATINFTYDSLHQLASQGLGGLSETWTYDAEGRPILRGGSMSDSITLDARGKRTRVRGQPLDGSHLETFSAAYDGFGHLVASGFTGGATDIDDEFMVDAFGNNLTRHRNRTAAFDENEMLEESIFAGEKLMSSTGVPRPDGRSGPGNCGPAVRSYEDLEILYDGSGNVSRQQSIRRAWDSSSCSDIFYRANAGHRWTWNFYDANEKPRVVQQYLVDTIGGVVLTNEYWYDALGRRVLARTFADSSGCGNPPTTSPWPEVCQQSITRSAWDGDFLLRESRGPGGWNLSPTQFDVAPSNSAWYGQRRNTQAGAIDMPLVVWSGDGVGLAMIRNWRGNAAGAVQISGTALGYEPVWPAAQVDIRHAPDALTSPPVGNSWWGSLVGDQKDATGLLYRRNRYYDPQTGRFTQEDPIGLAGGLNLYGYAGGDPINNSDPFGLCPMCIVAGAWAVYELASSAYDVYKAAKTVADPNASGGEKALTVGLAALSVFGPGGGYTGAVGLATKGAARETLGQLGIEGAQRTAANRAIGRATSNSSIDVVQSEGGDVVVRISRPGENGHQVIESTIKADGSKSVVQRAYDADGKLVHVDPKKP